MEKKVLIRSGSITFGEQIAGLIIQVASTSILARILSPEDYGVMAMVAVVTAFARLFTDLGLSSSTIQRKTLTQEQISTLYWINVLIGGIVALIVAACSPIVAWFYHRPELLGLTCLVSLNFLISGFGSQQSALLVRSMQFARKAIANLSGLMVALLVSITLALNGFGYWSLAIGSVCGSFTTVVLLNAVSGWRPSRPSRNTGIGSMLKFGSNVTAFDFCNYFARNLDNIVIGRRWGTEVLGLYNRAYQLLLFPINNLRAPINAVAFPALSRLQDQPQKYRLYFRRIVALLAFLSMPLTTMLFIGSGPLIELLLGREWKGVVPLFAILALPSFIQPSWSLLGVVMLSCGKSGRYFKFGAVNSIVVSAGFLIGVHWGAEGVAISYACSTYLIIFPSLKWAFMGTPVSVSDFLSSIALPAMASLVAGSVTYVIMTFHRIENPLLCLIQIAVVFGLSFAMIYFGTRSGREWIRLCMANGMLAFSPAK